MNEKKNYLIPQEEGREALKKEIRAMKKKQNNQK